MTPVSPDSPGRPVQPTSEAWALRAEWRAEPPSMAREDAGRALEALDRAAGESTGSVSTDEVPPVPESLRARWAEAYGRPSEETERERPAHASAGERQERRLPDWLGSWLHSRRLVWAGGAAAAMLAVMMMMGPGGRDAVTNLNGAATNVVRSPGQGTEGEAAPVALIMPVTTTAAATEVQAALKSAYPERSVTVVAGTDEAAVMAQREAELVVVNLRRETVTVTAWRGGQPASEFPFVDPQANGTPASVVGLVESADDLLDKPASTSP